MKTRGEISSSRGLVASDRSRDGLRKMVEPLDGSRFYGWLHASPIFSRGGLGFPSVIITRWRCGLKMRLERSNHLSSYSYI